MRGQVVGGAPPALVGRAVPGPVGGKALALVNGAPPTLAGRELPDLVGRAPLAQAASRSRWTATTSLRREVVPYLRMRWETWVLTVDSATKSWAAISALE